jgi:hypothetical protein
MYHTQFEAVHFSGFLISQIELFLLWATFHGFGQWNIVACCSQNSQLNPESIKISINSIARHVILQMSLNIDSDSNITKNGRSHRLTDDLSRISTEREMQIDFNGHDSKHSSPILIPPRSLQFNLLNPSTCKP